MTPNGTGPKRAPSMTMWKMASLGGVSLLATCAVFACNGKKSGQDKAIAETRPTLSALGRTLVEIGEGKTSLAGAPVTYEEDTPAGLARVAAELKTMFRLTDALAAEDAQVAQRLWQTSTRTPAELLADTRLLAQSGASIEDAGKILLSANDVYAVDGDAKGSSYLVMSANTFASKVVDVGFLREVRALGFSDGEIAKALQLETAVASGKTIEQAFTAHTWTGKVGAKGLMLLVLQKYDGGAELGKAAEQASKTLQRYTVPGLGPVLSRKRTGAGAWAVALETVPFDQAKLVEGGALTPDWNSNDEGKTSWTDLKAAGAPGLLVARNASGALTLQNAAWASGNMHVKPYLCESGQVPGVTLQRKTELITECVEQVKRRLKAPSQADFPSRMTAASEYKTWTNADCNQVVSSTVEAPNAFGVKLRQTWQCMYRPANKAYEVTFKE